MQHRIDCLARVLTQPAPRRILLRLLGTSLAVGMASALGVDTSANGKGSRRKDKKRNRGRRAAGQQPCTPDALSAACAGRCGVVMNSCNQAVDCGPCNAPDQPKPEIGASASCTVPNGSSLQAAIDAAPAGSTLTVCAGAFGQITINQHLTLVGAGSGNNPASSTILNGGNNGSVVTVAEGAAVTLQNLRIRGGFAQTGGGIVNEGILTVQGCVITGNATPQATQGTGGGIANIGNGVASLVSTTITQNTAFTGGGISQESQQAISLDRCTVQQNTASLGGGIQAGLGTVAVKGSSAIVNNQADIFGGGLAVLENSVVGFDATCRVTGNTAQGGLGGGIYNNGTVHLSGAKVSRNMPENCNGANPVAGCSN